MVTRRPYAHLRLKHLKSLSTLTSAQEAEVDNIEWYFEKQATEAEEWNKGLSWDDLRDSLSGCAGAIDGTDPNYE